MRSLILLLVGVPVLAAEPEQTPIFVAGTDGYHTYRIPSVIVTPKRTVLAFCEGRKSGRGDAGNIDLLLKRSTDNGETWGKTQVVWDDGDNTCGNPCPVVDAKTGTIWLLLTHNAGVDTQAKIVAAKGQGSRTVWVTHSTDDGATWAPPIEITRQVKKPEWTWYATGPGIGIQLRSGRLLIPCDSKSDGGKVRESHVIYSDDAGKTWNIGGVVGPDCNECQAVELGDDSVMLNMRSFRGTNRRLVSISTDGGKTFSKPVEDPALVEPACQASIFRLDGASGGILFSNPASTKREKMTVQLSRDEGKTWEVEHLLHDGPAAYSCLTVLRDGMMGCLYERGTQSPYEEIVFARFWQGRRAPGNHKVRLARFDDDPNWDGVNNRATSPEKRTIRQDFGYSRAGEVGGFITPAAEPAYYAKKIDKKTFTDPLTASGKLRYTGPAGNFLLGFFNAATVNEWRTPNSIALRLNGRGDKFYAYVEYCTAKWRAGADSPGGFATVTDKAGRVALRGFKYGVTHEWSIKYDPSGNKGSGSVTVTVGGETAVCHLDAGHKADGATFDRFGLLPVLKSADGGGEVWLDDVTINGAADDFARDPNWEGVNNRKEYVTAEVRPRFDFGYTATRYAGGSKVGELGGLVFRGDCRERGKLAAYGDRLSTLTLEKPLMAGGRIALRRGVSDSTTLLGFYNSVDSLTVNPSQSSGFPKSFVGIAVEGPSSEGFLVYPAYRGRGDHQGYANGRDRPHILPDGAGHQWSLRYSPSAARGRGQITVSLAGKTVTLDLEAGARGAGTKFDRFGLVTTWIDGNAQRVYFDDLQYTCEQ